MAAVDAQDRTILRLLMADATRSFKEIASTVGLATSTVYERVRRLREGGMLRGEHADVAPVAFGVNLEAMLFVQLSTHSAEAFETFQNHLAGLDAVLGFYNLAGKQDFAIHLAAPDADTLREQILRDFTSRPEVLFLETNLIFEHRRFHRLPDL
jgi:DNA-binding Lrp family transcriptional regulator